MHIMEIGQSTFVVGKGLLQMPFYLIYKKVQLPVAFSCPSILKPFLQQIPFFSVNMIASRVQCLQLMWTSGHMQSHEEKTGRTGYSSP